MTALRRLGREVPLPAAGDMWAFGGLAALVAVLFHEILFDGRVLYERDIHGIWHGQVESFVRCIASGSWPVWDPYLSFGQPFLANPGTQILYPWTWLNLVAPPALTYSLYVVGHLLFAGTGMFLLARRLGLPRAAAFVAASIWSGSGPLLSLVSLWHHFAGAAWMPWVLLAADSALRSPTVGRSLLWGAAFAGQILAGSADMCAMTGVMMILYSVPFLRRRETPGALRVVGSGVLAVGFAACLSAALWIPALAAARGAGRWDIAEGMRTVWSVHPLNLVQVLLPLLPTDLPLTAAFRKTLFDVADPLLNSLYMGVAALVLAAAAFTGRKPPWIFGLIGLGALLLALGRHTWAYTIAVELLPPLRILRYPAKATVPAAFAASVLCAYGFEAWRGCDGLRPRLGALVVLAPSAAGAAVAWAAVYLALHPEVWTQGLLAAPAPGQRMADALRPALRKVVMAAVLSTAVALLALIRLRRPRTAGPSAVAVAGLAVGGLLWAHLDLNPTAPADLYGHRPPIVDVLKNDGARRLYVFDYIRVSGRAYRSHVGTDLFSKGLSSLASAHGLQAYLIPTTGSRWGFFGSYDSDLYGLYPPALKSLTLVLRAAEETPLHERLLRMGAVDHVVALHEEGLEGLEQIAVLPSPFAAPIRVFRVPGAWPRSYVVPGARVADGLQAYRVLADPAFDPSRQVLLPSGTESPGAAGPAGTSRILELRHDRVRLQADLVQPGYLVLADAYDPGWKATVDGRRTDLLRANGAFRAVRLDAGRHAVEMVYRPSSAITGALISAASLLVGGAVGGAQALRATP